MVIHQNTMISLTDLSVELIQDIYECLPLDQLMKNKLVCKKVRFAIEQLNLNELALFVNSPKFRLNWKFDHKPVNLANSIEVRSLDFMRKSRRLSSFVHQFRGLRKLLIFEDCRDSLDHTKFNLVQYLGGYSKISKRIF